MVPKKFYLNFVLYQNSFVYVLCLLLFFVHFVCIMHASFFFFPFKFVSVQEYSAYMKICLIWSLFVIVLIKT